MMLLSMAPAAQAVNWHQVATTADGQQSQSVDIDSIERSPQGVRLKSAWENRTTRSVTTYLTEYDCKHQRYRDLVENGQPTKGEWKPLVGDPLNYATMKYACDRY
ncbi:MAG: hypothetical protein VKK04_10395 [Synechococcales bacterium]|nr:hypothetical protein [Synechococcales bacterium]